MKAIAALVGSILFAQVAIAQANGQGALTGVVLCDDTQAPARGAYVSLHPVPIDRRSIGLSERPLGVTTDLDGKFAISRIPPGEYYVVTQHAGYVSARDYIFPGPLSPEVAGTSDVLPAFVQHVTVTGGSSSDVRIRLQRGASITGSVLYSDGAPVPGVALTPKLKLSGGGIADVFSVGASHTDSAGWYRIDGLPDGAYIVLAATEGPAVSVFGGARLGSSGILLFAGGGMRPSKARVVAVQAPNEAKGVDVTIPVGGVYEVRGSAVAPDGHRLNHALVRLYPTGESRFSLATPLEADGTFTFHRIPPDSYTVTVEDASDLRNGSAAQSYRPAATTIQVGTADVRDVVLTTPPVR